MNNHFIKEKTLTFDMLKGWWTDAGTFDSLNHATKLVEQGA